MKKIQMIFILLTLVLLTGCKEEKATKVNVLIPSGGPTYAFLNMIETNQIIEKNDMTYEFVSGTDPLVAAMTSKSHEIVVAPTNLGAKLYNANSSYVYAATISFGNLFLVSQQEKEISDLENAKILAFGKSSTPDIILQKILQYHEINATIEYVLDVNEARLAFVNGKYDFVLLAEPVLSLTKKSLTVYEVLDLQEEYKKMTGNDYYPQAGVFIEKKFAKNNRLFIKFFLSELEQSIHGLNNDSNKAADYYIANENLTPKLPKDVILASIPNSNVKFLNATDSRVLLNEYFSLLLAFNSKTIGEKLPDQGFYLEG